MWVTNPPDKGAGDIVSLSTLCVQYSRMECCFSEVESVRALVTTVLLLLSLSLSCFLSLNVLRVWVVGMQSHTQGSLMLALAGEGRREMRGSAVAPSATVEEFVAKVENWEMFKAKITKLIKELSECSEGQFEILKRIDGLYYFMKCRSYINVVWNISNGREIIL